MFLPSKRSQPCLKLCFNLAWFEWLIHRAILCQVNEISGNSLAKTFDFVNINNNENQIIRCHGYIFTQWSTILLRGVKIIVFTWEFEANYRLCKLLHHVIFIQRLLGLLICWLLVALYANGDSSKKGKNYFCVFYMKLAWLQHLKY